MQLYGITNFTTVPSDAMLKVNQELLRCPDCKELKPQPRGAFKLLFILLECSSPVCETQWFLCTACSGRQRVHITNKQKLRDHISNHHSEKKGQANKRLMENQVIEQLRSAEASEFDIMTSDDYDADDANNSIPVNRDTADRVWSPIVNSANLGFEDAHSQQYFQQCFLAGSVRAGLNYLVMRSSSRSNLEPQDYVTQSLPLDHSEVQLRIAHISFLLTKGETELVLKALKGAYNFGCEDGFACAHGLVKEKMASLLQSYDQHNFVTLARIAANLSVEYERDLVTAPAYRWSTRIPTQWSELRSSHLEGARSIVANLPIPKVRQCHKGEHSYVSLIDCIRHFLAHRDLSDLALIRNDLSELNQEYIDHSSLSRRANEILQQSQNKESAFHSYILIWSDDVEPNRTKSNRGSVWLMTATIATHLRNGHCMDNTFPIAVGKKGDDHGVVVAEVERDLHMLRSGLCAPFYVGRQQKKAKLVFELFATLQDQPERRDYNCMRAGNGSHTGRFGVSADHLAIYKANVLPLCGPCLQLMERNLAADDCTWPLPSCHRCVRWDVLDDPNQLALCKPPSDYPITGSSRIVNTTGGGPLIKPFRITYKSLKAAIDTAHEQYVSGIWTTQQYEAFLEVEGLSTKFIEKAMEHSSRSFSLEIARQNPQKYQAIITAAELDPVQYGKVPYPPAWDRPTIGLDLHPDVIMHLLFLGVVKTTILQIQSCLSAQSKLNSFRKSTESYLKEFQKVHIEWIPIQPYQGERMGGWVSENYLGFSRLMPWFFQNIVNAVEMTVDLAPPEGLPPDKWLHRHNKYWLQVRGLDTKGKKNELKERVASFLATGAPDPLPTPDIPPADVEAVLKALLEMLRCVMNARVTPALVSRTRYAVRLFLSKFDSLTRQLRPKIPPVLSSYNFICLVNLPDAMEKFGPLRAIWEGGPRGEGFARFAKPFMTQGFRQNWHHSLMLKLQRAKAFQSLMDAENSDQLQKGDELGNELRSKQGSFHKYDSVFTLQQYFRSENTVEKRRPVSVVLIEFSTGETNVVAVVGDYDHVIQVPMSSVVASPIERFGFWYFPYTTQLGDSRQEWRLVAPTVKRIGFGMLLPLLQEGNYGNYFTLISSNWESLMPGKTLANLIT